MLSFGFGRRRQPETAPSVPDGLRLYAIGDVHGRLDLLNELLERIAREQAARPAVDQVEIILLGDLIDRGAQSAEVVRRTMAGLAGATMHALLGNHEALLLDALDGDRQRLKLWLRVGGDVALQSWGVPPELLTEGGSDEILAAARQVVSPAERSWLARRPLSLRRGDYLFAHAGIRPGVPLERQQREDLLWIREEFLDSDRDHGAVVVHGHSISEEVQERTNRIGIDTGAWRSGRLTALGLQGSDRWRLQT
jgi:serine/threonine protein phosphatase 1